MICNVNEASHISNCYKACSIDHNFGFYYSGHDELIFPVPGTYYFFDRATCLNGNPNMKFFVVVY